MTPPAGDGSGLSELAEQPAVPTAEALNATTGGGSSTAPTALLDSAAGASRVTRSGVTPSLDPRLALDRQELQAAVLRLRLALSIGLPLWMAFGFADWLSATYIVPGARLDYLLALRAFWAAILAVIVAYLRQPQRVSRRTLFVLDLATYTTTSALISVMCVELGGLTSHYAAGIPLVLLCHTLTVAEHWKKNVFLFGAPTLAYPATLALGALASATLRAQFGDPAALATFIEYGFFIGSTYAFMLVGGHMLWSMRQQILQLHSIGRYQLKQRIGKGGMGEVWRAYDQTLRRDVAIKLLRSDAHQDTVACRRFEGEVRAMTELKHPNTVRIFDVGVTPDGLFFYAMELLEGVDLGRLGRTEGPLEPARALSLVSEAARALAEAHARGIVHRDVKPENIFVTRIEGDRDLVKVLDFGIAKVFQDAGDARQLTLEGQFAGTPAYIAPEVVRGQPATARSDIYALGGVLYFLLARKPPFEGATTAVLLAHVQEEPVPPSAKRGQPLPAEVEAIVLRCLAKEPAERFASAEDLARALQACAGEVVASGARDPVSRS
jgi:serine/threonine-protein kinase